jgi:hypothetical protein
MFPGGDDNFVLINRMEKEFFRTVYKDNKMGIFE